MLLPPPLLTVVFGFYDLMGCHPFPLTAEQERMCQEGPGIHAGLWQQGTGYHPRGQQQGPGRSKTAGLPRQKSQNSCAPIRKRFTFLRETHACQGDRAQRSHCGHSQYVPPYILWFSLCKMTATCWPLTRRAEGWLEPVSLFCFPRVANTPILPSFPSARLRGACCFKDQRKLDPRYPRVHAVACFRCRSFWWVHCLCCFLYRNSLVFAVYIDRSICLIDISFFKLYFHSGFVLYHLS